jgi:hypothetical protein
VIRIHPAVPRLFKHKPEHPSLSYGFVTTGLEAALREACRRLGAEPLKAFARIGFQSKSWGCEVKIADGLGWLKVTGVPVGQANVRQEREDAARQIAGVPRPQLIAGIDWSDGNVNWRATVTALTTSPTLMQLDQEDYRAILDYRWIGSLRAALDALAEVPTEHYCRTPDYVAYAILHRFGTQAPRLATEWRTAHGDLSWDNVTAPNVMLLDWETWGLAPRGYDAAYLLVHSISRPVLARYIEDAFREDFASPSGCVSLLVACAEMLNNIEHTGDNQHGAAAVEAIAQRALEQHYLNQR